MPETALRRAAPVLLDQVRYADRTFWRTPVAAFFTIVFPLSFLVILSSIYGNEVIDPDQGLRLAQYLTPAFAVFGVCMACMVSLALGVAYARESGVLKRLRGTPLPAWLYIGGRVGSATWISVIALVVLVGAGVAFYGVQIIGANVPALILTLLVGIGCFCAIGLAIAAVAPTANAAQAMSNGGLIVLAMISGIFGSGDLPQWLDRIAAVFPLVHFVDPVVAAFNPYVPASTPAWWDLAVMAAWGIAAALVAARAWTTDQGAARGTRHAAPAHASSEGAAGREEPSWMAPSPAMLVPATVAGRPGAGPLVVAQAGYAARQVLRDPMSLFFAIAFPVVLVALFSVMYGPEATWAEMPLPQYLAAAFGIYGVATTAFVNLPGSIADQRAHLVLRRIRGTPMPAMDYWAGRMLAAIGLGLVTVVLIYLMGATFFAVTLPPSTWAATLVVFLVSIACFAACGLALVALVDGPQAVIAVALCLLLPLSFISDIFISTPSLPTVLDVIGWGFPLRHAVHAAVTATSGGALDSAFWTHLGVLMLWTGFCLLVAVRFFHWEPRTARS